MDDLIDKYFNKYMVMYFKAGYSYQDAFNKTIKQLGEVPTVKAPEIIKDKVKEVKRKYNLI